MGPTAAETNFLVDDDGGIRQILASARTIAVVGLSGDPSRASYRVASYLQQQGYRIIPVNPNEREVLGEPAVADLSAIRGSVDVVEVFRRSSEVAPHVDEAIAIGARVVWMQDGVIDPGSALRAHQAGLQVVMDRCMLRDHAQLMGRRP